MRRADKQMDNEAARNLLVKGEYGILSTIDSEGQPYGTPLNYIVMGDSIFIHGAVEGKKLDNIANNNKVCFSVIGKTKILPSEFNTEYESIIVFGEAALVADEDEKVSVLREFVKKYSTEFIVKGEAYIVNALHKTAVVKISIKNFTGKHKV